MVFLDEIKLIYQPVLGGAGGGVRHISDGS